jgi:thioredoxin-dependent peroxiredoxin
MLAEGDAAPDFTLPDQNGDELTLSDLRGETVVLYFYPRADTRGLNCSSDLR